jgi:UDP-N-acetylmuramate dehydrogenase
MALHCTWRAGGPARRYYRPADLQDLIGFIAGLPEEEPLLWVGQGSNLLIRDGGFAGTVIHTAGRLNRIERLDATTLGIECGAYCATIARFAARAGLSGGEFLAGIPGTMGGALAMNAGAFGGETWPLVEGVATLNRRGEMIVRKPREFEIGYRQVDRPPEEWFVKATVKLTPGEAESGRIRSLLDRRAASQPIGLPSCGSVFRNPPGDHAARLIEAAGLKGRRIGGAQVSTKHANFIVNTGDATATQIETLIDLVRDKVKEAFGVELKSEVHIIGNDEGPQ